MLAKSFKFTVAFVILLIIFGGAYVYFNRTQQPSANSQAAMVNGSSQSPVAQNKSADGQAAQPKLFVHPSLGFSFEYPSDFTVGRFDEGEGEAVLVQSNKSDGSNLSYPSYSSAVQIYIQSYDEPGPITQARIKKDLPGQTIANPQNISLAGEPALVFNSQEDGIGPTKEVWFVYQNQLYRVTAPSSASDLLQSILSTWKFDQ